MVIIILIIIVIDDDNHLKIMMTISDQEPIS